MDDDRPGYYCNCFKIWTVIVLQDEEVEVEFYSKDEINCSTIREETFKRNIMVKPPREL